ncbi:ribbon-helix-helix protein [Algoriphagus ratkowskyi]|uniref:Ribbon-helix-helix domain-containing protein n=1 Tax=Algoriphagus ratkowskyi TaxID=57028 RepID=A0A2W7RM75_9BACT|nr:ribbon-helix-helix domain-containing protein [Algoriphagus ratkowskyi]PZX59590.1 ribbon-helix-helix protein [Algoriphagus ratkowskyi]TXD78686.1 ribbon-helix-helix domain-containing protein [Algoriphagus ratkowskyi]
MATFTSTLPDDLLQRLADYAKKLSLPKNKLMENALNLYLDHLKRAEYVKSYRQAAQDDDILMVAEEGMGDYLKQIEDAAR